MELIHFVTELPDNPSAESDKNAEKLCILFLLSAGLREACDVF
jgi:hypothetical protein